MREPIDRRVELAPRQPADAVLAVLDDRFFVGMRGRVEHHGHVRAELCLPRAFHELREARGSHRLHDLARAQHVREEDSSIEALAQLV